MQSLTWDGRKLLDVVRDLAPLEEQGAVEGFFNNTENAGKLGGLVEDIRDAMMDYQVRALTRWISMWSNICARLRCSKGSTTSNRISTGNNKTLMTTVAQSW